ncbi:MAG TPA: RNA polymerase sigma factor [Polyangiaceae bacterium]
MRLVGAEAPDERRADSPSHAQLDDAEILAALRACDATAAPQLYARVRPQVDRTIARLLGRRDAEHDDLVQLAIIAIFDSLSRFRGECSLDTWTSRIAARTVFKELRRRKSQHRLFDPSCSGDVDGPAPASESREVSIRSALRRVRLHLDALDPVKAWTVVLHDAWGYDLREIAEITDVSVAAAQSRLVRGRADLQARLDGDVELADVLERTEEEA